MPNETKLVYLPRSKITIIKNKLLAKNYHKIVYILKHPPKKK